MTARRNARATLLACFLHFDLSFMLWVLLGALGIPIAEEAHLTPAQKGLVVALPILAGSLLRIVVGMLADRVGGKRVGMAMLAFLFIPLALGAQLPARFSGLLAVGVMLGTAGASFAVVLPLASRWFPPDRQGLALGIAAAGNSGTVLTNLIAPRLAASIGWRGVFWAAMLPLAFVFVAFAFLAKEPPNAKRSTRPLLPLLEVPDLWWLCMFYAVTFGGYVGLSSFLPLLLRDQFALTPIEAGYLTAALTFLGSGARPIGGIIADRVGGGRLLSVLLFVVAAGYGLASRLPALSATVAILAVTMCSLGLGNGAVFQVVPRRFAREIGAVTGLIGALGGAAGFLLPTLLGAARHRTGSFAPAFLGLAMAASAAALSLCALLVKSPTWREMAGARRRRVEPRAVAVLEGVE
jgi:NNP family nitrate/nitrite transporter-like MFS transporter